MLVRALTQADGEDALALYTDLTVGPKTTRLEDFARVLAHPDTWIFGAEIDDQIVSMATLHLLPNVTWGGRPYGLVENVVTKTSHQKQGFGRAVMTHLLEVARQRNAYKVMLQTGGGRVAEGFYAACGFVSEGKTGFQKRWPDPVKGTKKTS